VHFAERAILDNAEPWHAGGEDLGSFASTSNWTRYEHIRLETRLRPACVQRAHLTPAQLGKPCAAREARNHSVNVGPAFAVTYKH